VKNIHRTRALQGVDRSKRVAAKIRNKFDDSGTAKAMQDLGVAMLAATLRYI
jgi:hypothetical protein